MYCLGHILQLVTSSSVLSSNFYSILRFFPSSLPRDSALFPEPATLSNHPPTPHPLFLFLAIKGCCDLAFIGKARKLIGANFFLPQTPSFFAAWSLPFQVFDGRPCPVGCSVSPEF